MGNRLMPEVYDTMWTAAYEIQDLAIKAGMNTGREGALLEVLNLVDKLLAADDDEGLRAVGWWVNQKLEEMS